MSVVFRKIYADGGTSRDSGDRTRSLPSETSFVGKSGIPGSWQNVGLWRWGRYDPGERGRYSKLQEGEPETVNEWLLGEEGRWMKWSQLARGEAT